MSKVALKSVIIEWGPIPNENFSILFVQMLHQKMHEWLTHNWLSHEYLFIFIVFSKFLSFDSNLGLKQKKV